MADTGTRGKRAATGQVPRQAGGRHDEGQGYPAPAVSVAAMFRDRVARTPDVEAYRRPVDGGWSSVSWREVAGIVDELAAGLLALGIRPEERVAIASSTRLEWLYADLAVMCAGAATTTVYPTTGVDDVAFILADSGSRVAVVEDDGQVAKLRAARDRLPDLVRVVTFDGTPDDDWVMTLDQLRELGAAHLVEHPGAVDRAVAAVGPDHLATLIYTSGTTGQPKGVELPHRCWTYVGAVAEGLDLLGPDDVQFLWLPLSHSFGKMLEAVQLQLGFPTAVDGRMDHIVDNLAAVRPTFMAGPPRIFEKVHGKVVQTVHEEGGIKERLFTWAFDVGRKHSLARREGRSPGVVLGVQHGLADRLVLRKVRERLGGRIRFMISGSAALSPEVATWFDAAGLLILEGYGLTETSAASSLVRLDDPVFGCVGPPIPGTEVKIADDGEILVRGPAVMRGYHGRPVETAEVLDADGWFATGDIGELDEAGRLRITDRKKDLAKTSGGKYIAPQPIEVLFRAICPLASQMVVHADGRNYATALVALDPEALVQWGHAQGLGSADYAVLAASPDVRAYLEDCVRDLNRRLNRWETIKDFRVLEADLSVEDGALTPSMKVKRKVIETRYAELLDSMYDEPLR